MFAAMRLASSDVGTLACLDLGLPYNDGKGVPQDYILAHMWLNLAGATGAKEAVMLRDSIAKKMTPAQISEEVGPGVEAQIGGFRQMPLWRADNAAM
jgi:TPR repeat protein